MKINFYLVYLYMKKLEIKIIKLDVNEYYYLKNKKYSSYICQSCGSFEHEYKYRFQNQGLYDNKESFTIINNDEDFKLQNPNVCCQIVYYIIDKEKIF